MLAMWRSAMIRIRWASGEILDDLPFCEDPLDPEGEERIHEDVDDRLEGEEDPEPPPVGMLLAPVGLPLRVSVHIVARLVGLGERGGAASFHDLVVEGGEEVREGLETGGDRAVGQREPPILQILDESGRGTIVGELVDQNRGPDRDPELALGHEARGGGSDRGLGRVDARTGLPEPGTANDPPVGPDGDLEDFGLFRRSVGSERSLAGRAGLKERLMHLDRGREIGVTGASRTFASGLLTFFSLGPLFGLLLEAHEAVDLGRRRRSLRLRERGRIGRRGRKKAPSFKNDLPRFDDCCCPSSDFWPGILRRCDACTRFYCSARNNFNFV